MPVLISRLFLCRSCNACGQFIHKRTLKKKPSVDNTLEKNFGKKLDRIKIGKENFPVGRFIVINLLMIGMIYYTVKMANHMYHGTGPWSYIRGFFTKPPPEPSMENISIDSATIKNFVEKEKENIQMQLSQEMKRNTEQ